MEQQKKPFSKEEVLAVLEQLMGEMGSMDKLDIPDEEGVQHEASEMPEMEAKEDAGLVTDEADLEKKPSLVVAIGSEEEPKEEDLGSYLKTKMKGQMYK